MHLGTSSFMIRRLVNAGRHFNAVFKSHGLAANVTTSFLLMGVGDWIAQRIERRPRTDWTRTARMACMGFVFGPMNHYWYKLLGERFVGQTWTTVAKKVLCDQLFYGPLVICTFYVSMPLVEGQGIKDGVDEVKRKFLPTYKADWTVWPAVQVLNFRFIPQHLQALFVNFVTLGWDTYLSYMKFSR
ncbi:mpv17-like protein 2 [Oscarella lobularis]|uniref:mpv17-like protein 2 n=1 Tax=Oscarella lobularis TaxID=121494 RepID=UPI003313E558